MKLRRLLFHLHLYTGLLVGLLVSLTGITGSLLVYSHELDASLHPRLLHSHPGEHPGPMISPDQALRVVRESDPKASVQFLSPPREKDGTYEAYLKGGRRAHVDPYSGEVLGVRFPTDHPIGFLFALHTELLSGANGETVVGVGGLLLLLLGVTGVVLWWPDPKKGLRQGFTVQWRGNWKRLNWDLHRVGGVLAVLFLSLTAVTGAALVWGPQVTEWTLRITNTPPRPKLASRPTPGAAPLSLTELSARAESALPGALTTRITLAAKPEAPVVIRKKLPREIHRNGMSFVYLDQYSGQVLRVENALEATAGPRLLNLRYPLHVGQFWGPVTRVVYVLVGLAPAFLFVSGCLMWWNRYWVPRRRRAARREAPVLRSTPVAELDLPEPQRISQ